LRSNNWPSTASCEDPAEQPDAVDRAGILVFRGLKSLQPARQVIRNVRLYESMNLFACSGPGAGETIARNIEIG
jgi:hypothetical protein